MAAEPLQDGRLREDVAVGRVRHPPRQLRPNDSRGVDAQGSAVRGTEVGVYYSTNDGVQWQSLQLNLPIVAVTDLTIKDDDLVAATQGQSFWVLDDIMPFRSMDVRPTDVLVSTHARGSLTDRVLPCTDAAQVSPCCGAVTLSLPAMPPDGSTRRSQSISCARCVSSGAATVPGRRPSPTASHGRTDYCSAHQTIDASRSRQTGRRRRRNRRDLPEYFLGIHTVGSQNVGPFPDEFFKTFPPFRGEIFKTFPPRLIAR